MTFLAAWMWFWLSRKVWGLGVRSLPIGAVSVGSFLAPVEFLTAFAVWLFFAKIRIFD
jgi:hypothetical protein